MKQTLLLLGLCILSSCQIYKSDFDCPQSPGLGCVSVSHVNDLIDRGDFSDSKVSKIETQELNTKRTQKLNEDKKVKELKVIFYKGKKTVTRSLRVEDRK
jgi:hypothetical protein